ncbi:NAD-P-binding protein [Dentipellis sp. KUC8613]|nr:NAD-P-binding protein [Dentipellis sp. KUC8613]
MDLDLKGVHVLVTGANGGIGFAATRTFLGTHTGANVTAHFRSSDAKLQPLAEAYGPSRIRLAGADLTSEEAVVSLFNTAALETSFGPVEVAIINHATSTSGWTAVKDISLKQWESTMNDNLTSSFLVAREYMRGLQQGVAPGRVVGTNRFGQRASIVLVGSTAGKYGEAGNADYAASKSAIMYGFLLSLKNEIVAIAPKGRVNCIAPGWTRTPMAEGSLKDPLTVYRALATTPLKKVAEPEDIASQIAVIASTKLSGHVTGQVVMVEGGMEGRLQNMPKDLDLPGNIE